MIIHALKLRYLFQTKNYDPTWAEIIKLEAK